ncbi:hypothetical protein BD770DRAFT_383276 [Pilaira anomala]|nr:hypothetical protein BD770DRAFT_383276 [Pilaira anomala]
MKRRYKKAHFLSLALAYISLFTMMQEFVQTNLWITGTNIFIRCIISLAFTQINTWITHLINYKKSSIIHRTKNIYYFISIQTISIHLRIVYSLKKTCEN